jgi:hypothetical protein
VAEEGVDRGMPLIWVFMLIEAKPEWLAKLPLLAWADPPDA